MCQCTFTHVIATLGTLHTLNWASILAAPRFSIRFPRPQRLAQHSALRHREASVPESPQISTHCGGKSMENPNRAKCWEHPGLLFFLPPDVNKMMRFLRLPRTPHNLPG